jgi:hypothetical protein
MEIQPLKYLLNIKNPPVVDELGKCQGMKRAIFDMNFTTSVHTFKK